MAVRKPVIRRRCVSQPVSSTADVAISGLLQGHEALIIVIKCIRRELNSSELWGAWNSYVILQGAVVNICTLCCDIKRIISLNKEP